VQWEEQEGQGDGGPKMLFHGVSSLVWVALVASFTLALCLSHDSHALNVLLSVIMPYQENGVMIGA
jgi:uncharacterized membrane protein